jgi:hypothetical protein
MVEEVTPGKGSPRQGEQSGRGHCARGELEHRLVVGEIDDLYQEHAAWTYRAEVEAVVRLGCPHPERLGEVTCTLSEPCQPQR